MIEKSSNRVLEFAGAAVNAAAQLPFGKQREPAFDQVKPGTTGRREMQMEARVPQQPTLNGRGLVGCVVVKNQVQFQFIRHACVNGFKEIAKLDRSMTPMELADNSAGLGIERREQVDGAVALVVGSAALGLAGTHRQQRLTAVECLDLGLLINAQDQRPVRRVQIQTHDVSDFFNKQRVFRKLKTLDSMRLESKCTPDATDRRLAQATALGHRPRAPMVAATGVLSKVSRITSSTLASSTLRLGPGRGSSSSPASRRCTKRPRHLPTVCLVILSLRATDVLELPAAASSTIRARWAIACALLGRLAQFPRISRSSPVRLKGAIGLPVRISLHSSHTGRWRTNIYSMNL